MDLSAVSRKAGQKKRQQAISLEVKIPGLPVSVNHLYATNWKTKRRYMTKEGKTFTRLVSTLVAIELGGAVFNPDEAYDLELHFYIPLYYKNGSIRRWDVSDYIKAPEDALAETIGVDDRNTLSVHAEKHDIGHDAEPYMIIRIKLHTPPFCAEGENTCQ